VDRENFAFFASR